MPAYCFCCVCSETEDSHLREKRALLEGIGLLTPESLSPADSDD